MKFLSFEFKDNQNFQIKSKISIEISSVSIFMVHEIILEFLNTNHFKVYTEHFTVFKKFNYEFSIRATNFEIFFLKCHKDSCLLLF